MGAVSALRRGATLAHVVLYMFVKSVNLSFILEFKSDIIKGVSSAKMSHSFAAVEVLMKHTFFALSPFLYVHMGS